MIYGFRGANVKHFFNTINKIPHKNFVLGQNYRSTPEIVDAAQSLIAYNDRPDAKKIFSNNPRGEKVLVLEARNAVNQATTIANYIKQLVSSGQMQYRDAAILYRNSYISRNFEDAFCRHHIPYQIIGGMSFYKRAEIKTIISFLTFFENPENLQIVKDIINIPRNGIGQKTFEKIFEYAFQESASYAIMTTSRMLDCFEGMKDKENLQKIYKKVKPFIDRARKVDRFMEEHESVSDIIDEIVQVFDIGNYLRDLDEETCDERMANIVELKNMAKGYSSVQEFLEDVHTVNPDSESEDEAGEDRDAVQLMTMHASKGLEFKIVFIASANEGVIPSWRCESQEDIQEERRLFYVAMTRAKENLVISSTITTLQRGRVVPAKASSFISQIDPEYVVRN